jgi:tRNA nucleotidyltransferase (CCA-adding enzyme)
MVNDMDMFKASNAVLLRLIEKGFDAYRVGGYVRDRLLQRSIDDIDIATNALPEQVMLLFEKVIPTGLKHGTVTVCYHSYTFEVTTFRTESSYEDFRRPKEVVFRKRIEDDLARRDFTINAMAESIEGRTIDPYGGVEDLAKKRIRAVGNPNERMREDALRMMRAVRFATVFDFTIENETAEAIRRCSDLIEKVSMERVRDEFDKILSSQNPQQGLFWMERLQLWQHIFPFPMPKRSYPNVSLFETMGSNPSDETGKKTPQSLCWAVFFYCVGCSTADSIKEMNRFRCSNQVIRETKGLLELWDRWDYWLITKPAKEDWIRLMLERDICDIIASLNAYSIIEPEVKAWIDECCQQVEEIHKGMPLTSIKQLAIDGNDIIQTFNRPPGKWISETLESLLWEVATGKLSNRRETLLKVLLKRR